MIGRFVIRAGTGLIAAAALLASAWGATAALAQYPPPTGNVTVTTSSATAPLGGTVTLTLTVKDVNGAPVANRACTLSIASQPGTGASVTPASATTNASGVVSANLSVGTTAGVVSVSANCGGVLGVASVNVGGVQTAPSSGVGLPATGTGINSSGTSGITYVFIALAAAGVLIALSAGGVTVASKRRRRG